MRLETVEGYSLRLTADHRVKRVSQMTRYGTEAEWCPAGELQPGDRIVLNDHRAQPQWDGEFTVEEGYLLGLLVGDGTLKADKAVLSVWRPAAAVNGTETAGVDGVMDEALRAARTLPHRADFAGWQAIGGRNEYRLSLAALKALAARVGISPGQKVLTPAIERGSSEFYRGFLRGFFDADGSVQGNQQKGVSVRLAQSDLPRLLAVQRMLLRLGVVSVLYRDRRVAALRSLPDGKGGKADYPTKPNHELIISGENLLQFRDRVGFADHDKASRLDVAVANYRRASNRERFVARVASVTGDGVEDVYDVNVPGVNAFDANGLLAHNCGEQPLPPYGACLLGSINLARLVDKPFAADAHLDEARLEALTATAVRFLDNAIDVSNYPLASQKQEAQAKRRIGLGVTGLADALILVGVRYGTPEAAALAGKWMAAIERAAYLASAELAREKGAFPLYDAERFLAAPHVQRLPEDVRAAIAQHGIRNGLLTSIAPTGTISLLAGNVSSGVEPVFDFRYERRVLERDGASRTETVEDYAHALFREKFGADGAAAAGVRDRGRTHPARASGNAGRAAAPCRQLHLQDHQLPGRPELRGFQGCLPAGLRPGPQGLHHLPPQRGDGVGAEPFDGSQAGRGGGKSGDCPCCLRGSVRSRDAAVAWFASSPRSPGRRRLHLQAAGARGRAGGRHLQDPVARQRPRHVHHHQRHRARDAEAVFDTTRPFEVFINSKNLEHYAWTVALTRMISAIFRRGGDVTFVVEELKAIFDPQGGQWMGGRYVPSLLAAIGQVIEGHMIRTGFLNPPAAAGSEAGDERQVLTVGEPRDDGPERVAGAGRVCPRCGSPTLHRREACWVCSSCDYSKCN